VLTTIDFDHQLSLETDEVEDVRPERNLPPELDSVETAIAHKKLKLLFGVGRNATHRACVAALTRLNCLMMRRLSHEPLTPRLRRDPLPQGERVI
jgi:hypothetical protein